MKVNSIAAGGSDGGSVRLTSTVTVDPGVPETELIPRDRPCAVASATD